MSEPHFHKNNPFLAAIVERYPLSKPGSQKKTQHLVIDLKDSGIVYHVGDSIGVYPIHDPELVQRTLKALRADGDEKIVFKTSGEVLSLAHYFSEKANLTTVSQKLLQAVLARQPNAKKKEELEILLQENQRDALKAYLGKHEVWDFLLANPEVSFTPQEIADLMMPLLPRFYSIASSQKHVGGEIHLTVAPFEFESNGHKRRGVCTHYLSEIAPLHESIVPIFVQPSHGFHLPEEHNQAIIMVGPGTGIAPFRAFMQERIAQQSQGKHWLFFGERNRDYDFFYEADWQAFSHKCDFRLDVAFSRDQEHKVYVQNKMKEKGEELFHWLENGAYLYICGDAQRMAKDVEATLHSIIQEFGKKEPLQAREYIKQLRQQKRYQRDVY